MSMTIYMTQSMVEHFNTYGSDYKGNIDNIKDDNGVHGSIKLYENVDNFLKGISGFHIERLNNGLYKIVYQSQNKNHCEYIRVLGFFDATDYIFYKGSTSYLVNFMMYGGVVRIDGNDFAGKQQINMMKDAANALITKLNKKI